jgi:GT2 family glycosyltransferase
MPPTPSALFMPASKPDASAPACELGVVVIGRNEGERLRRCLEAIAKAGAAPSAAIVYVDSGSSDQSRELARSMNVAVVELDLSRPFTAGRARNEGFAHLSHACPNVEFVQFLDGDCELDPEWLAQARATLGPSREIAVVTGELRERFPERSIYNRICAIEWNGPVGEIATCGGNFMIRAASFKEVGGFNPDIIAAEDDDLCLRVRAGGKIVRIDRPMAWHDAAMTRFGQWWMRAVRAGYAFAQVSAIHGRGPSRHFVRETRSAWFFAVGVPLVVVALAFATRGWGLLALPLIYAAAAVRIALKNRWRRLSPAMTCIYACHCLAAKFPQVIGQVKFWYRRAKKAPNVIIEHK